MAEWSHEFNGVIYTDPRDELKARALIAEQQGDRYVAVPCNLLREGLEERKQCAERTVVAGNREQRTLIEIRCERYLDPQTGRHTGPHSNGNIVW
jgi:hypothetical protein